MSGFQLGRLERQSLIALAALRPTLILPPNRFDYYVVATASNVIVVGTPLALRVTGGGGTAGTVRRGFGWASSVHMSIGTATSYAGGDSLTLEIRGLDEFMEPAVERITLTNPALTARSVGCFSRVDSITPVAKVGLAGATPTIGVGIGDGGRSGDAGLPQILVPHLLPSLSHLSVLFSTIAATPVLLQAVGLAGTTEEGLPGRYLVMDFAAADMRTVGVTFMNVERSVLR